MPRFKKLDSPVGLRPCPRCGGRGTVPCRGGRYDSALEESHRWAQSFHHQLVAVEIVTYTRSRDSRRAEEIKHIVPGIGVASKLPGGWGAVDVYMPISARIYTHNSVQLTPYGEAALWCVSWGRRKTLGLLNTWPADLVAIAALLEQADEVLQIEGRS